MTAAATATTSTLCAVKKIRPMRIVSRANGESNW